MNENNNTNRSDMMNSCWYFSVDELSDEALFDRCLGLLPWDERRTRIMRFRSDRDRRLCLGAGLLLLYLLRENNVTDLTLEKNKYGKPNLKNHSGIHFNLSHSGSMAVCAISDEPIGADVELLREWKPKIAGRCFTPEEISVLDGSSDRDRSFFLLWTRKESYMKILGRGLSIDPSSFCVLEDSSPNGRYRYTEMETARHMISVCSKSTVCVSFHEFHSYMLL